MNKDFDLIIIGGGGAGLAAGIMARKQGASVMVLEADTKLGGATALSAALAKAIGDAPLRASLSDASWVAGRKLPQWRDTARIVAGVIKDQAR